MLSHPEQWSAIIPKTLPSLSFAHNNEKCPTSQSLTIPLKKLYILLRLERTLTVNYKKVFKAQQGMVERCIKFLISKNYLILYMWYLDN